MVHLGVQCVAGTDVPLGIVPTGTGNDFATALGLPAHDAGGAAQVIADWHGPHGRRGPDRSPRPGSGGTPGCSPPASTRPSTSGPTGCAGPRAACATTSRSSPSSGVFKAVPFRVTVDGEVIEAEAMLTAVGNNTSYGGGMKVAPGALLDDGLLHVTVLRQARHRGVPARLPAGLQGHARVTSGGGRVRRARGAARGARGHRVRRRRAHRAAPHHARPASQRPACPGAQGCARGGIGSTAWPVPRNSPRSARAIPSVSTRSRSRRAPPSRPGRSVLVAAPTGAGKTVVGEFAVHLALRQGRKCFYTTPIKALSNQKFGDLVRTYGAERVGLLTGDNSVNGDAPVVVMTTEVLRNMLYASSPALDNLGYVVMDEVHYLGRPVPRRGLGGGDPPSAGGRTAGLAVGHGQQRRGVRRVARRGAGRHGGHRRGAPPGAAVAARDGRAPGSSTCSSTTSRRSSVPS